MEINNGDVRRKHSLRLDVSEPLRIAVLLFYTASLAKMSGEKRSLLGDSKSPRRKSKRKTYTDDGAVAAIEMTQSGSSSGSLAGLKIPASGRGTPRLSNAFENSGVYQIALSWKDISVKVNIPGKSGFPFGESRPPTQKTILRKITGTAKPGCLLAVMGASGSGKSTLLNVLTQRNTKDYLIEGEMMLNGVPLTPGAIKNVSAYVQQSDLFMETLTVREQLQFRAMLRMDKKYDTEERMKRVEEVIAEMGLTKCANTRIGSESGSKKGISGGERKRLGFASEALTNPPIFFCDEPTSSLDSFMAQSIVQTLQKMAQRGRVILCTIHQPSSEIFAMFTQVLILSEGRVAFMGAAKDCLAFFNQQNYPCPSNYNPSDHYILTLAIVPGNEADSKKKSTAICDAYMKTENAIKSIEYIDDQKKEVDMYDHVVLDQVTGESRYTSSFITQARNLFWRAWICQFRDPMIFYVRSAQVLVVALLLSSIYFDTDVDQKGIININGALFLLNMNFCGTNLFAVLTAFPLEMNIVKREFGSGLYLSSTYFFMKSLAELPVFLLSSVLFMSITYWTIGLKDSFEAFLWANIVVALSSVISVWVGYTISIVAGDPTLALSIASPVLIPLILFSGIALNIDDIPDYFKWMKELSWFRNAYQLMMVNQWKDWGPIECPNATHVPVNASLPEMCAAITCPFRDGDIILEYNSLEDERGRDIGQMLGQAAGFYLLALIGIVVRTRRARE
ncbi:hypothetical protein RRG08_036514 [Elysia crispata]|uniref:ABC transporter domain-containing protein n=1 Tax=Elysia crispata TaxID=231223 RepID=A0AAE0ZKB3_9GAST|nr:hypothetical protein RRG08_036514 [Elysia crispata]